MATTTADAIRDRIIAVVRALVPVSLVGDEFIPSTNEGNADFVGWAEQYEPGAFRCFQVVELVDTTPEVSDAVVALIRTTFRITVAYPHSHRTGAKNALDRYRVMSEDQHKIEYAVGMEGRVNFTPPTYPDACWVEGSATRETGDACDFLVIEQTMQFYRARG